jgi:prepilin-type processing-associated H-X9-DG protein
VNDGFFYKPSYGRNVAFADGHVEFLRGPISRELAAALLTVDGGEDVAADLERPSRTSSAL